MPTYVYETVPARDGDPVRVFEVRQGMNDAPLAVDPASGLPVRRVITGGIAIPRAPSDPRAKPVCRHPSAESCSCCP